MLRSTILLLLTTALAGPAGYAIPSRYGIPALAVPAAAAGIWVSPNGSDAHAGTKEQPLASLAMALRKAREWRRLHHPAIAGGIHIILRGGIYRLSEPVFIRPEDAGSEDSPTWIEAAPGEKPVLSGGIPVTGWRIPKQKTAGLPAVAQGNIWIADAPQAGGQPLLFRQLWVNNVKAIRAREHNGDSMARILSWNHKDQSCRIPVSALPEGLRRQSAVTLSLSKGDLSTPPGLEMVIHQWWAIAVLRIQSIDIQGDSARLRFLQPESRIQSEHPWPAPWLSKKTGNSAFYLVNALQCLDQPGEWYLDTKSQRVMYWPRPGEDMHTATVTAPVQETLVRIEGTIDNPVSYVFFNGIGFEHTGWRRPSQQGHVPLQAGMYLLDAYKLDTPGTPDKKGLENQAWIGRPPAAAEVAYAHHTGFAHCHFMHLASTGLDYRRGTHGDEIKGCVLSDIGGTGIQVGVYSDEAFETHLPYDPSDRREVCANEHISNNLVTGVTNEDWGCVGISAGYVRGINIEHNEVSEVSYSGICVGWGWTKTANAMQGNRIYANYVHHYARHMYDVGGIYTLSAQPGTVIYENRVDSIYTARYAHDPNHWFYFYFDEGSSYITIKNNWCPGDKFMRNSNGPGNVWENNGPQVADTIKANAGLEPAFKKLRAASYEL